MQVAEVVVAQGIASTGADAGALQLLTADRSMLEVVYGHGSDRTLIDDEWRRSPPTRRSRARTRSTVSSPCSSSRRTTSARTIRMLEESALRGKSRRPHPAGRLGSAARCALPRLHQAAKILGVAALVRARARPPVRAGLEAGAALRGGARRAKRPEPSRRAAARGCCQRRREAVASNSRARRAKDMLLPAVLEEGRRVPETWLGFPLRSFAAGPLRRPRSPSSRRRSGEPGRTRVFDVTGIPAARSDAALLVVTDVSERERRRRAEREFVDNAAHELRTPLAAITSAIERLQAGARDVPRSATASSATSSSESTRLNRLASSLLVLARAQTREEQPRSEEIALRELFEELFAGLDVHAGVELVVDCPTDPRRPDQSRPARARAAQSRRATLHATPSVRPHLASARTRDDDGLASRSSSTTRAPGSDPRSSTACSTASTAGPAEERRSGFGLGLPIVEGGRRGDRRSGRDRVGRGSGNDGADRAPGRGCRCSHERAHPRRRRHGGDPRRGHRRARRRRIRGAKARRTAAEALQRPRPSRSTS